MQSPPERFVAELDPVNRDNGKLCGQTAIL
jgi:hypothetical protein